ncbi:hypothetical protein SNEBB_006221 [Seison nebaliae]|nr:hypothetical protein SNEBB_006221 [Seison nebaliae]
MLWRFNANHIEVTNENYRYQSNKGKRSFKNTITAIDFRQPIIVRDLYRSLPSISIKNVKHFGTKIFHQHLMDLTYYINYFVQIPRIFCNTAG